MAITINSQPTYPNVTHTNLIYEISSTRSDQPQFQYVMDVKLGSTLLARIKQYPNPQGKAVFDPSKIFNDYLEYPTSVLTDFNLSTFGTSDRTFNVFFGEQYSDNFTNPVTLYSGVGTIIGVPGVAAGNARVFPGTVDPNNGNSFNWLDVNSVPRFLTKHDPRPSEEDDYHPLHMDDFAVLGMYGGGAVYQYLLNSAGSTIYTISHGTADTLAYVPVGPANLAARGVPQSTLNNTTVSYVTLQSAANAFYFCWKESCFFDRTNFLFVNKFGAWDSFSSSLPTSKDTNLTRDELKRPFVNYSNDGAYSNLRRGKDYYNLDFTDNYVVSTNWLSQDEAEWITDLLESPEVYIQSNGGQLIPIVITNSSYTHFTNKKSQKTFEFEIQYQYANARRSTS